MSEMDGALPRPQFGLLPPRGKRQVYPGQQFRYAEQLEVVRRHPNQPACIAVFEKGHPKATANRIRTDASAVAHWVQKFFPLEVWEVRQRRIADTWSRRELWVVYRGVLSPDDMRALRAARLKTRKVREFSAAERRAADELRRRLIASAQAE